MVCLNEAGDDYNYHILPDGRKWKLGDRTWGWYETFEEAEEAILNNYGDLFECSYNYACIEEVPPGVMVVAKVKQWYKATFDETKMEIEHHYPEITKCEPPPYACSTVNFSMG